MLGYAALVRLLAAAVSLHFRQIRGIREMLRWITECNIFIRPDTHFGQQLTASLVEYYWCYNLWILGGTISNIGKLIFATKILKKNHTT